MFKYKIVFVFVFFISSCQAESDFSEYCMKFRKELESQSRLTGTDFNLKYGRGVDFLGKGLKSYTILQFGGKNLRLPFTGEGIINVIPSIDSVVKKTDLGFLVISYYEAIEYRNVGEEFLNFEWSYSPLFDRPVFHEWLVFKGFEYSEKDLICDEDKSSAGKIIAFLSAKSLMAEKGAEVVKLQDFNVGFLQVNKSESTASLVVLNDGNVLNVTIKFEDITLVNDWLGVKKEEKL